MHKLTVVFFGSFQSYSVQVLEKLIEYFTVIAAVTTPPKPAGRHMKLTPTEVQEYAQAHHIPIYPLESLEAIPKKLERPDFIVVAGYGKLIPPTWLDFPKIMAINMHPSLLPRYRGAMPAEWAILKGEKETGVTLVKMSPEFDKGEILVQKAIPIKESDRRETLYRKLYDLGAQLLVRNIPLIAQDKIMPKPQPGGEYFYARRITRDDGFIPWDEFKQSLTANPSALDLKLRALSGWPGLWSTTPYGKRIKLIRLKPQPLVQLEGKKPVSFVQFVSAYPQILR